MSESVTSKVVPVISHLRARAVKHKDVEVRRRDGVPTRAIVPVGRLPITRGGGGGSGGASTSRSTGVASRWSQVDLPVPAEWSVGHGRVFRDPTCEEARYQIGRACRVVARTRWRN